MSHRSTSILKPPSPSPWRRFGLLRVLASVFALFSFVMLAACNDRGTWHETDISGISPDLKLKMTRAEDGKEITAADYNGKVTLLYFGYTFCPDICPTTLANVAEALKGLGGDADKVSVLFVTVDPGRDTPAVMKQYTDAFGPQFDGLIGTADQLAALARRYRIGYSVTSSSDPTKYEVNHSPAVYVFGEQGKARLLIGDVGAGTPDLKGVEADLRRLVGDKDDSGWFGWLRGMV